jgi:hypothetical protein
MHWSHPDESVVMPSCIYPTMLWLYILPIYSGCDIDSEVMELKDAYGRRPQL